MKMNQEDLNKLRAMAGMSPSYNSDERNRLNETEKKYQILREAQKKEKDEESAKEAADGGAKFDPKGGEKSPKQGKDVRHKVVDPDDKVVKEMSYDYDEMDDDHDDEIAALRDYDKKHVDDDYADEDEDYDGEVELHFGESKKADKDYDGDGKIESGKDEYMGAKDKAIKKAMKKKDVKEAEDVTVWGKDYGHDDGQIDRNENPDQFANLYNLDAHKISVPTKYKTSLKEEIGKLRKEADRVAVSDPRGSELYYHTADAFESLLGHLNEGTERSMNLAQIDMNRIMSPMTQRLPNEVYMFIVRGGKPAALDALFKQIKVKKDVGADLSKTDYTK